MKKFFGNLFFFFLPKVLLLAFIKWKYSHALVEQENIYGYCIDRRAKSFSLVRSRSLIFGTCLGVRRLVVVDTKLLPSCSFAVVLSKGNNFEFKAGRVTRVLPHL
uniref:Putative secreted protein n=1 Tax=Ixodes ricinus TaxID=34613 RepID=A0A6B0UG77_IXORI